ncbi:MAG: HNH endonuclease [Pleurocapsa sp.]
MHLEDKELKELFKLANTIGKKRYHKLTEKDFENYRAYDYWRYIKGDGECGTTQESKNWIKNNSDWFCPICGDNYSDKGGRTIDHKLPRSQYPWLSIDFDNLWVICQSCNKEKGEMHWYEYERYMFINYPDLYLGVKFYRPTKLLQSL